MLAVFFICLFVAGAFSYNQLVQKGIATVVSSTPRTGLTFFAVDGDLSCVRRYIWSGYEAWLRIDLGDIYSLKSVKVYSREGNMDVRRRSGFSILVSNNSVLPPQESSCYADSGNVTLPAVMEQDCEKTARYVWFYQTRFTGHPPLPEICEVQVFGCELGRYGENCLNTCGHCRNNVSCGITSGECDSHGCTDEILVPPLCTDCLPGLFGETCTEHCSQLCKDDICDRTGTCLSGCQPGYTGSFCNTTCPFGKYGPECAQPCKHCLQSTNCHHVTGSCFSGCKEGYKGTTCNIACSVGEYGRNCEHHCGHCLNNEACSRFDGLCSTCEVGYQGLKCDNECSPGTYGRNCSEICGACLDDVPCHHVDGHCPSGCSPGWKSTLKCDAPCPSGTFGPNCINKCSGNCLHHATCDKETGKCNGCNEGWTSDFCNEKSKEPITDLEKMTLEHLKLDNQRLILESEMLEKKSKKISIEESFLKIKEKYIRMKILSEFQIFKSSEPEISATERKSGQNMGDNYPNISTRRPK